MSDTVFALLDDGGASPQAPRSRLYTAWVRTHRCSDPSTLEACWQAVRADQARGLHAVLLADYEWGARLIGADHAHWPDDGRPAPALRVLMFERLRKLDAAGVEAWLASQSGADEAAGTLDLRPSVDDAQFHAAIDAIQAAIANGETYQVNHTYRLNGAAYGPPLALYRRLRARQAVPYGALIALPAADAPQADGQAPVGGWVLSRSPELFVRKDGAVLTAKPMKGTARRVPEPIGDSEIARELAQDVKNRAENLMIVDLLRNDLGRIARIGSVRVPQLFEIEPYATVFQMTSTVQATLRDEVDLPQLLRAVYPCGSITGAPKHYTMGLIARLESTPRGLYCGAIGWLDAPAGEGGAPADGLGDFCLSVAIRTVVLGPVADTDGPAGPAGTRALVTGVGAGIVQDSVAADEAAECRLKARYLTSLDPGFELFETLRADPGRGVRRLDAHLRRLGRSAARLGFPFDLARARALLDEAGAAAAASATPQRLRLALAHDGRLSLRTAVLAPLPERQPDHLPDHLPDHPLDGPALAAPAVALAAPPAARDAGWPADEPLAAWIEAEQRTAVDLWLDPHPLPAGPDPLAGHKTSRRARYDAGVAEAEGRGAFDMLFQQADGRLCEGGRSTVLLRLDGRWWTPPLADGALPGVLREALLADADLGVSERRLHREDLARAEAVAVCNALRGVLPVHRVHGLWRPAVAGADGAADAPADAPVDDGRAPIALFDLDHTLIDFDSGQDWTRFLIACGARPAAAADEYLAYAHQYVAGTLDIHAMHRACVQPLAAFAPADLARWLDQWAASVRARLRPDRLALVQAQRAAGARVAIVTATTRLISAPVAALFGVGAADLLCTATAMAPDADGALRPTGEIDGQPCFRQHKIAHVEAWLAREGLRPLAQQPHSRFWSDSASDLPLLEAVREPVAVAPDVRLRAIAQERGWPVVD
ncbi:HAD-IB family phosphatase [Pseudaquabacterium rugosum]|uniref:HAD-IB family phosphatase n=1 Tax=Pseudaquabacterium rugosum TaxID=2984194 RepID=A0ABU9B650_9BURK